MADEYIGLGNESEPDDIAAEAFDYLESVIPGWVPSPGNLDTILIEVFAQEAAIERGLAAETGVEVFRFFGELVGTLPIDPIPAVGTADFVLSDTDGHLIPINTQFVVSGPAGDVAFITTADALVNPGSSTAPNVPIEAVEPGESGNGLSGVASLVNPLVFVTSVTIDASTSGGVDGETDDEYLNRLSERLRLQAPRPILPRDFEVLAKDIAGVKRAVVIDGVDPGVNEKQTISHDGTGGTFGLTFEAQSTPNNAIPWNGTAAQVKTALEALSNIAVDDIIVTGGPLPATITVEFVRNLGESNRTQMTSDDTNLTPGASTITIATTQGGVAALTSQERMVAISAVDEDGEMINTTVQTALLAYLDAKRELNFVVHWQPVDYTTINVTTAVTVYDGYDATAVKASVATALSDYLHPKNWGLPPPGAATDWLNTPIVRYLEVAALINSVDGVNYISSLTVNGGTSDVTMIGRVPLSRPGTMTVT